MLLVAGLQSHLRKGSVLGKHWKDEKEPAGPLQPKDRNHLCKDPEVNLKEEVTATFTCRFMNFYLYNSIIPQILNVCTVPAAIRC